MSRTNRTVLWIVVGLLVTGAAACSGADTVDKTTAPVSTAAPVSTSQQAVGTTTSTAIGGGNIFTTGTPEQQTCLRNALGDTVFEAIASGARTPTETDNRAMNPCIDGGPDNGGNETASQPPQIPPDGGGVASPPDPPAGGGRGGFASLPPETQACLSNSLGVSAYEAIISGSVAPTTAQNTVMEESCGYPGSGPSADLTIADYPFPDAPTPPSRSYPDEIHSISESRFIRMKGLLAAPGYIDNLLEEGFNTWNIHVTYMVDSDGARTWIGGMGNLTEVVSLARLGGLAVRLVPANFQDLFMDNTPQANREALYGDRLSAALELASLAERLNVEYFTPIVEAEGQLDNSAFGGSFESDLDLEAADKILDPEGDPALTARSALMSTWLETMAPELRGVFSGRLVAHFGTPHPGNLVPSYDLVGQTLDHHRTTDLDAFRALTAASLNSTSTSASRSGISWGVVETYFYWSHIANPSRATDWDTGGASLDRIEAGDVAEWEDQEEVALLRDLQDDNFRIALDEYSALQGGSWFDSGGWIQPGQEIAGSAAETVLSDFFRNR